MFYFFLFAFFPCLDFFLLFLSGFVSVGIGWFGFMGRFLVHSIAAWGALVRLGYPEEFFWFSLYLRIIEGLFCFWVFW